MQKGIHIQKQFYRVTLPQICHFLPRDGTELVGRWLHCAPKNKLGVDFLHSFWQGECECL